MYKLLYIVEICNKLRQCFALFLSGVVKVTEHVPSYTLGHKRKQSVFPIQTFASITNKHLQSLIIKYGCFKSLIN